MIRIYKQASYKEKIISILGFELIRIISYRTDSGKKIKKFSFCFKYVASNILNKEIFFYLKVNRICNYSFMCLQNWINVIHAMGGDFCIICDKPELKKQILKKISFYDSNIKIIKSYVSPFKGFVHNLADKYWIKAANAHLSTYWHAKKYGIKQFWNIDADDTMLLLDEEKTCRLLADVATYANQHDISNFALDMWRSRTAGKQWSFGITYTRMNVDYFKLFQAEKSLDWKYYRQDGFYLDVVSLDCYFTYCKDVLNMKNETFYINNTQFIHWGNVLSSVFQAWVNYWVDGKLYYPILGEILGNQEFSSTNIAKDCIKFDYNFSLQDGYDFIQNKLIYSMDKKSLKFLRTYYN